MKKAFSLSTAYFPPIQYFTKIFASDIIYMEAHENYNSQSYRNRTVIIGPNGKQTLSIPVKKISGKRMPIRDVRIDYTENWQKDHLRSIEMAYKSSPFYEFYIDALLKFFTEKYTFLFEYNLQILNGLISEIGLSSEIIFTKKFNPNPETGDFRFSIHPKQSKQKPDTDFEPRPYIQVFESRFRFMPNLSILDLLFNQGPNTELMLGESCRNIV
ncbi:MAG: WbqC family protein [Bacteroidota bacterium]|nr:WbqC family protein [Bacteroidota bacterium]